LSAYPDLIAALQHNSAQPPLVGAVEAVARRRGRPIRVIPWDMPDPQFTGAWLATPEADFIFFERRTPAVHGAHTICHELSHMLLGHTTLVVSDANQEQIKAVFRGLIQALEAPESVRSEVNGLLLRTVDVRRRRQPEEVQAEALGGELHFAILQRASLSTRVSVETPSDLWTALARDGDTQGGL
jgi:hypothetical protein